MRALVVTNMLATPDAPGRGQFVRDQVAALRLLGADVTLDEFAPGDYLAAARGLRARHRRTRYDVVHAHFGLTAYPALAVRGRARVLTVHGTDVRHGRTGRLTRLIARRMDLVAAASAPLGAELAGADPATPEAALPAMGRRGLPVAVLPCGVALDRFRAIPRREARAALGLSPDEPCLLFPADPDRPGKRHDLALRAAAGARLHTLGATPPDDVPLWINAANAVLVPSDAEGFGLAVLEALACDVPVIATPVGVHPEALAGVPGSVCAPFDADRWRTAAAAALAQPDPRVPGRRAVERWSSVRMAERVTAAWERALAACG